MWRHRYLEPGERYGRWTVLGYAGLRKASVSARNSLRYYLCRCDCGREREVAGTSLTRGVSLSCGCLRWDEREAAREAVLAANPKRKRRGKTSDEVRNVPPRPYVPEHPELFTDDWMFLPD